jgi:hypothetical protein
VNSETNRRCAALLTGLTLIATSLPAIAAPPEGDASEGPAAAEDGDAPDADADADADAEIAEPEPEPEPEPSPSADDPVPDADLKTAEERYYRAVDHFNLGKYELAVPLFEAVYREIQSTDLLFNLGQSHWKWFSVDPKLEHLEQARTMFQNYDKAMRGSEGYNYREIEAYLAAIEAQIAGVQASARVELRPLEPRGPDPRMLEFDRQRRINSGMTITGVVFSVLGGASLLTGGVSLAVRSGNGFALDQTGGSQPGTPNPFSAEEHEQLRTNYLRSGQVAFGTLIAGAVLFPVGVALAAIGSTRNKRLVQDQKYAITPTASGVMVRF